MKRPRGSWSGLEFYAILAVLALCFVALHGLGRRVEALERKPCIMTGAHTGCQR